MAPPTPDLDEWNGLSLPAKIALAIAAVIIAVIVVNVLLGFLKMLFKIALFVAVAAAVLYFGGRMLSGNKTTDA